MLLGDILVSGVLRQGCTELKRYGGIEVQRYGDLKMSRCEGLEMLRGSRSKISKI